MDSKRACRMFLTCPLPVCLSLVDAGGRLLGKIRIDSETVDNGGFPLLLPLFQAISSLDICDFVACCCIISLAMLSRPVSSLLSFQPSC